MKKSENFLIAAVALFCFSFPVLLEGLFWLVLVMLLAGLGLTGWAFVLEVREDKHAGLWRS